MNLKSENDTITNPEDSRPAAVRKQQAGRGIVTFYVIFALGAFSLYLFILIYGSLTSN